MKISIHWLKDYIELTADETPQTVAEILTDRGLEVESINDLARGFEKVITVQIQKKVKHPDADRLSLCTVTDGTGKTLEIVCGAQNMKEGDKVACALEGASLPNGLKIKAGKIRGVASQGMLCSKSELGLEKESEGILILPKEAILGSKVSQVLGREDVILELKLTPNRGDCASYLGVARELSAALNRPLKKLDQVVRVRPEILSQVNHCEKISPVQTKLEANEAALQFHGAYLNKVKIGPSPSWLVQKLETMGLRTINNIVDATNFVLFECGQPTHAYDAKKLEGGFLTARFAHKNEKLKLLDESEIEFQGDELIIADAKKPVALAGVMGGGNSEVSPSTTEIFIECAEFSPAAVRKSASRFLKHTDASYRFEREVDPLGLENALDRLVSIICEISGAECCGFVKNYSLMRNPERKEKFIPSILVSPEYLNHFLGLNLPQDKIKNILEGLGCALTLDKKPEKAAYSTYWRLTPPSFRRDIKIKEDIAEELARCIGYDQIPMTLPVATDLPPISHESQDSLEFSALLKAKKTLSSQGLYESVSYSFTDKKWLSSLNLESSVKVQNPLSEEQERMIPSLYPNLLKLAVENQSQHFGSEPLILRFFECRPVFSFAGEYTENGAIAAISQTETGITEEMRVGFLLSGPRFEKGLKEDLKNCDFYDAKAVLENLCSGLGTKGVRFMPFSEWNGDEALRKQYLNLYHPNQSMIVWIGKDFAGICGRVHPAIEKKNKIRSPLYICEIKWKPLFQTSLFGVAHVKYESSSEFPPMERDFALVVKKGILGERIVKIAHKVGVPLVKKVRIFDVYEGSPVPEGMTSVAVRVILMDETRSLEEIEAETVSKKILSAWEKELGAQLR